MLEDTPPKALKRYLELLRAMSFEQKRRSTAGLCAGIRRAAILGLRSRFPEASEEELRVRLTALLYGVPQARRIFKEVPDDLR